MTLSDLKTNTEEHKVLITTSGVGSRLGKLTDYTNKSLVRVGDKPAISHIVERYHEDTKFVVTLGHYGSHVKEFLQLAYPERNFTFVEVKNFKGPSSSLLHSMNTARKELQCPFIFHVCDAIILDKIPNLDHNWIAGVDTGSADQYRTLNVAPNNLLAKINEKGEINFDLVCPGLVGIKDFSIFWKRLDDILANATPDEIHGLSDLHVLQSMIDLQLAEFSVHEISRWYDIGEPFSLARSRDEIKSTIDVLDKVQENIFIIGNSVIKFFYDKNLVSKRVERAEILSGLVPKVTGAGDNFFRYEFVDGRLFSKTVNPKSMLKFLNWAQDNLWTNNRGADIKNECHSFYLEKTQKRIEMFLGGKPDLEISINGEKVPKINDLMSLIDHDFLTAGLSSSIHGDLILDNVIETTAGFALIDWRQDFAGRTNIGDLYYDLAKLNHNLIFNHDIVNQGHYIVDYNEKDVVCDIHVRKNLLDCQEVLYDFIMKNGYDLNKVKLLTAIIWINMSPLHEHPLDKFLFNFGKYNLHRFLASFGGNSD